jgi:excisionase family DNA binding protein
LTSAHKHELFLSREALVSKILTTKELAEYLKLTEVTIYKYANEGKIPGFKIGSRWRFDKEKIDDLLKCEENEVIKQH